jgi:L-aminopeptidase/D-esterase-like protein
MKTKHACLVLFFTLCMASVSWAEAPGPLNAITDVPGIFVGHYTGLYQTGTTVVMANPSVVAGVTQRGGAPGTRETDLLNPANRVDRVNAIVLTGGSAYGLAAASGVMKCLENQKLGWPVGGGNVVPIVPSAVIFDPGRCDAPFNYRPDYTFGMNACQAVQGGAVEQGNVGAGAGAVSDGFGQGTKGGIGTASVVLGNGIIIGAIVAVNAAGSIHDEYGNIYAASFELNNEFDILSHKKLGPWPPVPRAGAAAAGSNGLLKNTTIAVIATNVELTKAQATKIAMMADDGLARAIRPIHSPYDGDTVFAMGTGEITMASLGDPAYAEYVIGSAAADVLSRAVVHAILAAESTPCYESYCDRFPKACKGKKKGHRD